MLRNETTPETQTLETSPELVAVTEELRADADKGKQKDILDEGESVGVPVEVSTEENSEEVKQELIANSEDEEKEEEVKAESEVEKEKTAIEALDDLLEEVAELLSTVNNKTYRNEKIKKLRLSEAKLIEDVLVENMLLRPTLTPEQIATNKMLRVLGSVVTVRNKIQEDEYSGFIAGIGKILGVSKEENSILLSGLNAITQKWLNNNIDEESNALEHYRRADQFINANLRNVMKTMLSHRPLSQTSERKKRLEADKLEQSIKSDREKIAAGRAKPQTQEERVELSRIQGEIVHADLERSYKGIISRRHEQVVQATTALDNATSEEAKPALEASKALAIEEKKKMAKLAHARIEKSRENNREAILKKQAQIVQEDLLRSRQASENRRKLEVTVDVLPEVVSAALPEIAPGELSSVNSNPTPAVDLPALEGVELPPQVEVKDNVAGSVWIKESQLNIAGKADLTLKEGEKDTPKTTEHRAVLQRQFGLFGGINDQIKSLRAPVASNTNVVAEENLKATEVKSSFRMK